MFTPCLQQQRGIVYHEEAQFHQFVVPEPVGSRKTNRL